MKTGRTRYQKRKQEEKFQNNKSSSSPKSEQQGFQMERIRKRRKFFQNPAEFRETLLGNLLRPRKKSEEKIRYARSDNYQSVEQLLSKVGMSLRVNSMEKENNFLHKKNKRISSDAKELNSEDQNDTDTNF